MEAAAALGKNHFITATLLKGKFSYNCFLASLKDRSFSVFIVITYGRVLERI
jgi:hypothetical protein